MVWLSVGKRQGILGGCLERYFRGMILEKCFERGGALRERNEGVLSKKRINVNTRIVR